MRKRRAQQRVPGARCMLGWGAVIAVAGALGSDAAAQDIETVARLRGLALPQAYYDRVAADPTAFTLPNGLFSVGPDGVATAVAVHGTKRMLVVPALFSDSPDPHVSSDAVQQSLFDGPAERGTLTEAYREMSRGMLTVTGAVVPWVRTSLSREQVVGTSDGLGEDARLGEYLVEALSLADPGLDFGLYDNDGPDGQPNSGDDDGWVDAIAFEFLEVAASCGGPGVWPHRWGISPQNGDQPYTTDDLQPSGLPVQVDAYIIQSAVDCDGVNVQDASTIAHEFGHVLGLPDYYHPTASGGAEGRRWVLGCWELMAAGSWGCGPVGSTRSPFGPTHLSARSKNVLGWVEYIDVGEVRDLVLTLDPVQTSGQVLRIALDDVGQEYLILEYRSLTGFDAQLPAGGVLIYHQDLHGQLRPVPGSGLPYFLALLEQDDNNGLIRNSFEGGDRGEASDAWGADGRDRKLNFETGPNSRLNDGSASSVAIHSLWIDSGRAYVRISTARAPEVVSPTEPMAVTQVTEFERRLRIAGGYMPYRAEGTVPDGLHLSAQGDELVVSGSVQGPGPFELALRVVDAEGASSPQIFVPLTAGEWLVGESRLVQVFLQSEAEPLTRAEMIFLDFEGNGNGRYDVGDLRAWLRAGGGAEQPR